MRRFAALALILSAGAAFAQSETPGRRLVTPPGFNLPEGGSCAGEIARFRAIQENDIAMGHVAQSVYNRIKDEIAAAERECAAGRDAQAQAMIVASKKRHGYPVGL